MRYYRGIYIFVGCIFGLVVFVISVFFMSPINSLIFGVIVAFLFIVFIYIVLFMSSRLHVSVERTFGHKPILKENVRFFDQKYIGSGMLFLTPNEIYFSSRLKSNYRLPLLSIKSVTYGKISKQKLGVIVTMYDGNEFGFTAIKPADYIEKIGTLISDLGNVN